MKTKFYLCILLLAIASGCSEQPQTVKEYSIAEIISNSKPITLSELGAEIKTIKLKTPDSILISASLILTTTTDIYLDSRTQVYRFDRDGNFLNKISTKGKAKNEYLRVYSMFTDLNNNICIHDGNRILTYTPEGEFLGLREMNQVAGEYGASPRYMFQDKRGNIFESFKVIIGAEEDRLIVTNPERDTILVSPNPIKYEFSGSLSIVKDLKSIIYSGDDLVYHPQFSDSVYTFDNATSSLRLRYYFKNPNPLVNEDFKTLHKALKERIFIGDIVEDSKYIYVTVSGNNKGQLYLINRDNGESFKADFNLGHPDDDELSFVPKWKSNDELVFFYDVTDEPEPTIVLMKDFK